MRTAPKYYREGDEHELVAPVYAYAFQFDAASYFWTSFERSLTIYNLPTTIDASGSATFQPVQINHGPLEHAADFQSKSFSVTLATTSDPIRKFFITAAATKIRVTVIRLNGIALALAGTAQLDYATDGLIVGGGLLGETIMSGSTLQATVTPEIFYVDAQVPRYYFQALCNHVLYDGATCKVDRSNFRNTQTITSVNPWDKSFNYSWSDGEGWYAQGYAEHPASGGRFAITWNSGSQVWLAYWSPDLKVGDQIKLYAGCDHTTNHCQGKFNNLSNYGGFPYIPDQNPIYHGV